MFKHKVLKKNRLNIMAAMVILIATVSGVANCLDEIKIIRLLGGTDEITRFETGFQRIKRELPPSSVIGYYSDKKYDARTFSLTRYTLSPRIVVLNIEHALIIGNFSKSENSGEFAKAHNLSVVKTIDQNMVLLKKGGK
jgi:hypothetical protein